MGSQSSLCVFQERYTCRVVVTGCQIMPSQLLSCQPNKTGLNDEERWRHRARSIALSKSDFATDCLFCRLPAEDDLKKEMMLPTKLVQSTVRKRLHKHAHWMATGQTGRNRAQMHCTTASGTLTAEQKTTTKKHSSSLPSLYWNADCWCSKRQTRRRSLHTSL